MIRKCHAPFFLIAALVAFSGSAFAQGTQPCNEREKFLELLSNKYSESVIAGGVTTTGGLVEVLSSPEKGTWSIIVTSPKGISCLVAVGEGWRELHKDSEGPEA